MKSLVKAISLLALPILVVACDRPTNEEVKANADSANAAVSTMASLYTQLTGEGVFIDAPLLVSKTEFHVFTTAKLKRIQGLLNAFVKNGKAATFYSSQPYITTSSGNRETIRDLTGNASQLLQSVNALLSPPDESSWNHP